jgi:ATP-dependent DNA helicase RecG
MTQKMNLHIPLKNLEGIYKMYAGRLTKLNVFTLYDLLFHIPSRYEDYSFISPIHSLQQGQTVTIKGIVIDFKNSYTRSKKTIQQVRISDNTGTTHAIWFNQPYLAKVMCVNTPIALSGRTELKNNHYIFTSPEYEILLPHYFFNNVINPIHTGRLVPVYPETKGISSKWIRRQIYKLLHEGKDFLQEYMPADLLKEEKLPSIFDALEQIHFPNSMDDVLKARERLSFDELFSLQLAGYMRKKEWQKNISGNKFLSEKFTKEIEKFYQSLPFRLTNSQQAAIKDIFSDLTKDKPMNRLLQGDVGSGKTIVASLAIYLSFLNGYQSVFMAPTEILATQHFNTIEKLLSPFGVKIGIQTGSKKNHEKHHYDVLVGTHAILSEKVIFKKLGLAIIDEQQRFGVEQRTIMKQKGNNPHLLTMTATPIPRTIALTIYGDLDMSVLSEMPQGRKKIKTWLVPNEKRESAYRWIEKQINNGHDQVFIVCPFIEISENMITVKAAIQEFETLQKNIFPSLTVGLLHGKMAQKEKNTILQQFENKEIDILIATPVVEVGIDFPNATIIVIEAAERFGLAQLHQLRGRVGRGNKQSYCLLFTDSQNMQTKQRLSAMETIHIGSQLAELDLKLRGPGELYGTAQHGRKVLKVASFSDFLLIARTKKASAHIFPKIQKFPLLVARIKDIYPQFVSAN